MRLIINNLYILKLIFKASPSRIFLQILERCVSFTYGAFYTLIFFRYIINSQVMGRTFWDIMIFMLVFTAVGLSDRLLKAWLFNIYIPKSDLKITEHIYGLIFDKSKTCDISAFEDPEYYQKFTRAMQMVDDNLFDILQAISTIIGIVFALILNVGFVIWIDPVILLFCIVPIVLMFVFAQKWTKNAYKYDMVKTSDRRQADYVKRVIYLKNYSKELRLTNVFEILDRKFHTAIKNMIATTREYGVKIAVFRFFTVFWNQVLLFTCLNFYIVHSLLVKNNLLLGDYASLSGAVVNTVHFAEYLSKSYTYLLNSSLYTDNLKDFLKLEPSIKSGGLRADFKSSITFKDVSFGYKSSDKKMLKNINLRINKGEKIAIVGINGAGKTSLTKLLLRLYDATEGQILLDDVPIEEYNLESYRKNFTTAFQDYRVYALSVKENIEAGIADGDDIAYHRALSRSGLAESAFGTLDTIVTKEYDKNGIVMSGGQQQKLALSRVFMSDAPIAILDEPSSALDPISERRMFENIFHECRDKTIIFISHRLSSVKFADRILLMEDGMIVEEGTHDKLMQQKSRYSEMYTMQHERYMKGDEINED